ncbi:SCL-interrupting locus protein homolog [Antennarius striatus]|uniref:SCL-interrupting locus protein homolog n=1 Tax=Antennarius striatus TaxID=241820 RepID=UPI0035B02D93
MSVPVRLQALPSGVFEAVVTPENVRGRSSITSLSFPKSRSALWDGSPAGEKLRLHLCSHRKPRLVLSEKALRLAWRHARHNNKPHLHFFLLGSLSVDTDEGGVTLTLDRFDPGRHQPGPPGRVPSALLPGDVLVPCLFSMQASPDAIVQSEAELHLCFKVLQQQLSGRQSSDLSQLVTVRGGVVCSRQCDSASFSLSWSSVCPSVVVDTQPVRPVPIIPTALLRSLTSIDRPLHGAGRQRGFLTMDQTRKLLLLLESDPKASNLPLVGLWLSGVTHVYNPQVWAWCLHFLFSSALQDRVFSESRHFLLVLFGSTHRAPQFYQCRGPEPGLGSGPHLDFQLLTSSQCAVLYQHASSEGQALRCDLAPDARGGQTDVFMKARRSFSSAPPLALLSISDHDSGVEDEDLSPRPSPSPHAPAQQARRVQPSVPELSLLVDGSFTSAQRTAPPLPAGNAPTASTSAPTPLPHPLHLHSTPNSNLQQPCSCCPAQKHDCTSIFPSPAAAPPPPPPLLPAHSHHLPPPPPLSPAPPFSMHHHTLLPPPSHLSPAPPPFPTPTTPLSSHRCTPPPASTQTPPPASTQTPPPASTQTPPTASPLDSNSPASPRSRHHQTPPPSARLSAPPTCLPPPPPPTCPCGHPPSLPWSGDAHPTDAYQLLLHQDRQLRLLQAQVQMLLEAQGRLHPSSRDSDTQTSRVTASVAVETGASLLWAEPVEPLPQREVQTPHPSSPPPPFDEDLPALEAEDGGVGGQEVATPSGQSSGPQSPVLGESASMYGTPHEQNFYQDLMNQLSSRLQESDSRQDEEEEESDRPPPPSRKQQGGGDPVVSATLRQLQRLGVEVDEDLTRPDRKHQRTVESSSTLASINPAAVLSRLQVSDPTASSLFPGGSVDLSLEANAIALRYLSDSQLSRLSLGGHAPCAHPASYGSSALSPSDMSVATRRYMRKYGLIEEEEEEEEEEDVQEEPARQPLTQAQNVKLLPQSQLIRDLRPKMRLLAGGAKANAGDKENCPTRRASFGASGRHTEGSVGNILDLSRLRRLPKLF